MVIEAACTAAAAVVAGTVPAVGSGWPRFTIIGLLAVGMGLRNAAVRRVGVPDMSTTVLTTTLTGLASGSVLAGGTNPHARLGATTVLSMFAGALVGAVLVLHAGAAWALGVAAGIVTVRGLLPLPGGPPQAHLTLMFLVYEVLAANVPSPL